MKYSQRTPNAIPNVVHRRAKSPWMRTARGELIYRGIDADAFGPSSARDTPRRRNDRSNAGSIERRTRGRAHRIASHRVASVATRKRERGDVRSFQRSNSLNDERCVTVTMDDARERGREGIENARGAFASRLASVKRAGGGGDDGCAENHHSRVEWILKLGARERERKRERARLAVTVRRGEGRKRKDAACGGTRANARD